MNKDYSQAGEVSWMIEHVQLPEKGYFVDVGANDGITDSNTYWFEKQGWKGLCVEPDSRMVLPLTKNRTCRLIFYAIGRDMATSFYEAPLSAWSGTTPPNGASRAVTVPMFPLDRVLYCEQVKTVDLLSVDTEGTELAILKTIDLDAYQVRVLVVEWDSQSRPNGNHEQEIRDYMAKQISYDFGAKIGANLIYVRKGYALQK